MARSLRFLRSVPALFSADLLLQRFCFLKVSPDVWRLRYNNEQMCQGLMHIVGTGEDAVFLPHLVQQHAEPDHKDAAL
jgi:hypothetical protein